MSDANSGDDLAKIAELASRRRPWRVMPRRHYFELRPILAMLDLIAFVGGAFFLTLVGGAVFLILREVGVPVVVLISTLRRALYVTIAALAFAELTRGWTPGKHLAAATVRCANGMPADLGRLATRFACKWSPVALLVAMSSRYDWWGSWQLGDVLGWAAIAMAVLNALSIVLSNFTDRRAWYDFVSGTAVFEGRYLHEVGEAGGAFEVLSQKIEETRVVEAPDSEPDPHRPA